MVSPIGFRVAQIITENVTSAPPAKDPPALHGEAGDDPFAPAKPLVKPKQKPKVDPKDEPKVEPKDGPKDDPKVDPVVPPTPRTAETPKCPANGKPIHVTVFTADMAAARDQRSVFDYVKVASGEKLGRDVYTETYKWIGANLAVLTKAKIVPPEGIADRFKNGTDSSIADRSFVARAFAYVLNTDKTSFNKVVTEAVKALADDKNPAITPQALTDTLTARWTPYGPRKGIDVAKFVTDLKGADAAKQAAAVKNITAADKKFFAPLNVTDLAPVLVAENAPERYRRAMAEQLRDALECEAVRISKANELSGGKAVTPSKQFLIIQVDGLEDTSDKVKNDTKAAIRSATMDDIGKIIIENIIAEFKLIPLAPIMRKKADGTEEQVMGLLAQFEPKLLELAQLLNREVSAVIIDKGTEKSPASGVVSNSTGLVNGELWNKTLILPQLTLRWGEDGKYRVRLVSQWYFKHAKPNDYFKQGLAVDDSQAKFSKYMIEQSANFGVTFKDKKEDSVTNEGPSKVDVEFGLGLLDNDGRVGIPKKYIVLGNADFGGVWPMDVGARAVLTLREEAFELGAWTSVGLLDLYPGLDKNFGKVMAADGSTNPDGSPVEVTRRDFAVNLAPAVYLGKQVIDGEVHDIVKLAIAVHYRTTFGDEPSTHMVVVMPSVTASGTVGGVGLDGTVASYHSFYPGSGAEHNENALYVEAGVTPIKPLRIFANFARAWNTFPGPSIGAGPGSHSNRGVTTLLRDTDEAEVLVGATWKFPYGLFVAAVAGATLSDAAERQLDRSTRDGGSGWRGTFQALLGWDIGGLVKK